ncbi:light-harvesting protein [Thiorhodococcus mannitoliphagus]|uniref:Light-harvesting protein n=1 Tax=Thiorhodococcus mannitoliphagus TaxID=329406 RepID=A0A6P1E2J8_9GAMM|nr:light-harvesting antenna LH1, alpha subunit [Thiorhodococcus mannitoliphagus]NEX21915.1 light-harvesting protein [Thiorhodococcus mannitoliphagus]
MSKPSNPADDWKIWLVLNPATWLMPLFYALLVLAIAVHFVVFSVGLGWQ